MRITIAVLFSNTRTRASLSASIMLVHTRIGYPTSWMHSHGVCHSLERKARFLLLHLGVLFISYTVIEMLLAVLSVCSPEELEDEPSSEDDEAERALVDQATSPAARAARRQQIRNKILAVGRLQMIFQNLRYVTPPHGWVYTHT